MKTLSWFTCFLLVVVSGCGTYERPASPHHEITLSNEPLPFKEYDAKVISTIQSRWSHLLDEFSPPTPKYGRVVVSVLIRLVDKLEI